MQNPRLPDRQSGTESYTPGSAVPTGRQAIDLQGRPVHVIERIIEKERDDDDDEGGGLRLPNPFKIIMLPFTILSKVGQVIKTGCLLIILLIIVFFITIFLRPPFLWNPFKDFLNDGVNPQASEPIELQDIYFDLNSQGKVDLTAEISEEQLTNLFRTKVQNESDIRIELEEGLLRMVINIDSEDHPLWLVAEVSKEESGQEDPASEKLGVTKVGFGRFGLPGGINSFLSDQLFSILTLTRKEIAGITSARLFGLLIDEEGVLDGFTIEEVNFKQDKAVIQFSSSSQTSF